MTKALARTALAICALATVAPASAQSPGAKDPAAAEALFREGITALDAGNWAAACPKFAASFELDPSAGTSINVARCHEHDGKLATAWGEYQRARTLARESPGLARRQEIEQFVDGAIAALEPRLPRLTIDVAPRPAGLRVERDGLAFPIAALGQRVPVDPGKHVIAAEAPGHAPVRREIEIAEGRLGEVKIDLVPAPVAPAPTTAEAADPSPAPPPPPRDAPSDGRTLRLVSYALIGVGAAGVGLGAITGAMALGKSSDVESSCETERHTCADQAGIDAASSGRTLAIVSTIGFGAGAALAAGGIVLLIVGPKSPPKSAGVGATFDGSSLGVTWGRAW